MTYSDALSTMVPLVVAFFLLIGSGLTLVGTIGLLRMRNFYERMHPPTLGATCGAASILLASLIYFAAVQSRIGPHEILIAVFVTITTPVTLTLLARAAIYRDRQEGSPLVPPRAGSRSEPVDPA